MTSEAEPDLKLEIGHVLMLDVVAYSTLLITEQKRIMSELKRIVRSTARFQQAEAEGKLVCVPTGDGILLVFFDDPEAPIECAMEIGAAIKSHPDVQLRMGIHSGPVNQVVDVNERANVAGAGIDMAQRVMDCGDAGHILLSKRVADDLAPFPRWNPHLHELGECEVKHGRKISLVNFYTDTVGNPQTPKKWALAKPKPLLARKSALIAAAVLLIVAAVIGSLIFWRQTASRSWAKIIPTVTQPNTKSIAVLPFENLSHDPDNAYFADGIQEEILDRLSKIADLKVISRTSTQRYKSKPDNLLEIARQLGVANILEGTVQKAADQVRVNVQLINAQNDSHLWADKFDRKLTDIFAVESEIATKIADTLQAKLTGSEQKAIAARPTENSEAHQLYLKGRYFWNKLTPEGFQKAIEYFQRAIEKDPAYALAYSGLADSYEMLAFWGVHPPQEMWPKGKTAALKALELDDNLAEAHVALGWVSFTYDWDWAAAEKHFERALALNPASSTGYYPWYSIYLGVLGRSGEALAEAKRALDRDPVSPVANQNLAEQLYYARRFDDAIEQCRKTLEMDPSFSITHSLLGRLYLAKGMDREALAESEKYLTLTPRNPAALASLAYVHARSGQRSEALQLLDELRALPQQRYVSSYLFALVYAALGEKDQAFEWLEKAYEERSGALPYLKVNPTWDPLRSDPRFGDVLRRVGLLQPAAQPNTKSIAVLPFENLSHDPDNAYFADGIQEEILSRLSKIADLKVISRTSTQRYKSAPENLTEIAKQLGVAHVLEGTVQKAADQVRVNVQLINARNDSHLWADKFDRKLTDIFAVESEIAAKIADTLQAKLTGAEQSAIRSHPTESGEAHQLYLRGRYFVGRRGSENLNKAIDYFNQALARDPNYALAYAGLSDCYDLLPQWSQMSRAEYVSKAKSAANKALQLDDSLAEAHTSLAAALFSELNFWESKRESERAIELNPNYAFAHYSFGYTVLPALAEFDRAIAEIRRAVDLDPFSVIFNANLGYLYIIARRYPEAIVQLQKTLELDPNFWTTHRNLGEALELGGQLDQAIAEYEKSYKFSNDDHALAFLAHAYGLKGEREKALQLLTQLKEFEQRGIVWNFGLALVYLGLGDKSEAVNRLERSYQNKEAAKLSLIKVEPMLDPLRGDPRFEKLADLVVPPDAR